MPAGVGLAAWVRAHIKNWMTDEQDCIYVKAVADARLACGFSMKIEVECRSVAEAIEAAAAGADVIMLDNFDPSVSR